MNTNAIKAADGQDLPLADVAEMLLQQAEATLSVAWDVCDHTIRLDSALHDIRCAIDRVRSAREAIGTAASQIAVDLAAAIGQPVAEDTIDRFRADLANVLETCNWPGTDAEDIRTADAARLVALRDRCGTVGAAAYQIVRMKQSW